jgi:hypothetical protein
LTFFALPDLWWWGRQTLGGYRWNLYSGSILLVAVIIGSFRQREPLPQITSVARCRLWAVLMLLNAVAVHILLAEYLEISEGPLTLLAKFVLLFFLIVWSIRDEKDLRIVLVSILLGAAYIGYMVTIDGAAKIRGGRLEGVGAPGARQSNELASLIVTILPLIGGLIMGGLYRVRVVAALAAPLILNVVLLCNSRGGFLGLVGSGVTLLAFASGKARKRALIGLALGSLALVSMLNDPRILERFKSTFESAEERDKSAASRFDYWTRGLLFVTSHPLGVGGDGFKRVHAATSFAGLGNFKERSLHNGYLNQAAQWGIQGLILQLLFLAAGVKCAREARNLFLARGDSTNAFLCVCLIAGMVGFVVPCMFGDFLDSEWGFWMTAIAVACRRLAATGAAHPGVAHLAREPAYETWQPQTGVLVGASNQ